MFRWLPFLLLLALCAPARADADLSGMRTLSSPHLTLMTDLPADAEIDALPGYFEQAFEQWCDYFGADPQAHAQWHVRGFLMQSRERFQTAGLISDAVPEFATGYSFEDSFWLFDQTSVYYRRHLMLHEAVHCFMNTILGGTGPSWYAEGMAELLATHQIVDGKLTVGVIPKQASEVPKWGRVEVVQQGYARRKALTLQKVFNLSGTLHGTLDQYGWCWAAAAFLDHHPRYRQRFRQLPAQIKAADFNAQAQAAFAHDRARMDEDWQVYISNLDYGYDLERMDFEPSAGRPLASGTERVSVAADRGWQSTGVALSAGKKYHLKASGRYQVAAGPPAWHSEPGGVTIRYEHGEPLGMLLAAVRSDDPAKNKPSGLIFPIAVGLETTLQAPRDGTLYLRVNDSAGSLDDNKGAVEVEITTVP